MKILEFARFMTKWEMGPGGCWLWTMSLNRNGYGRFSLQGGRSWVVAHRYAYEALIGPIPAGLLLDHRCRVRGCCNPFHMEPVTVRKNTLRGEGPTARAWNGDRSTLWQCSDSVEGSVPLVFPLNEKQGDGAGGTNQKQRDPSTNNTLLSDLGTHANALTEEAR